MNIVFVLIVVTVYSIAFALTRRPWAPWAICALVSASAAAALVFFTDVAGIERAAGPSSAPAASPSPA